jgi:Cu2+-exporting ATPase
MDHQHAQYTCPMHPEVIKDAPGKCPKCGMDLIPLKKSKADEGPTSQHMHEHATKETVDHKAGDHDRHGTGGHAHHAGMIEDFKKRFYIVLVLTVPIMTLSPMIQHWLEVDWSFSGSDYFLLVLSSVVFFYGGWPFLKGLVDEVK